MLANHTASIFAIKSRNRDSTCPRERSRESRKGQFEGTRTQYWARNRAQGAEPTCRPGCGGQLDQVTGIESPAQRWVKLEVRLGLGEGVRQRNRLSVLFPGGWAARQGDSRRIAGLADVGQYAVYRHTICHEGDNPHIGAALFPRSGGPTNQRVEGRTRVTGLSHKQTFGR